MKTLEVASLVAALALAAGCGRTGTICETAVDCGPGQACTVDGCVFVDAGRLGGGSGGGGGATGGGTGGGLGGGSGGGMGGGTGGGSGGGGSSCRSGETQCPSGCKNLSFDLDNCGSCGRPCPEGANGRATCSAGICGITCAAGFADCDQLPQNGCEANFNDPSSCGACRNVCPAGPNSAATCSMGACGLTCAPGFANCDFFTPNGCETDLSSPANCGLCGNVCRTGANQAPTCTRGQCGAQCLPAFADCDGLAATGCEASLNANATCGACNNPCPPGVTCGGMVCGGTNCPAPAEGVLTLNTTVMGMLPVGAGRFPLPTCAQGSPGFDQLWTFTLASTALVTFETGGSLDTVVYVRASCTAAADLGCNDDTPGIGTLSRVSLTLQPGTYSVFVKEWGNNPSGGPYSLSASVGMPAMNSSCLTPRQLSPGFQVLEDTRLGVTPSTACLPGQGGQLFYQVDVPANQRATIAVTPQSLPLVSVRLLSACGATSCLSSSQGGGVQVHTFDNLTADPTVLLISVSATVPGIGGPFGIRVDLGPIPSSLNTTCTTATPLQVNGMTLSGQLIDQGGPPSASCLPAQAGRVLYYSVLVPARQAVQVLGAPQGFDLGLRVFTSCAAVASCAAYSDVVSGINPESIRITNPSFAPQTYIVAVSSTGVGSGGQFGIAARTANPFPSLNAFCDSPTVLPAGSSLGGELELAGGMPLHNVCLPSSSGYTRYYSVAVPPSATLQAVATPTALSGIDVGVRVLSGCAAANCLASSDVSPLANSAGGEAVVVSNVSGASQTYLVVVSGVNTVSSSSAAYSLVTNVMPTAANAFCSGATPVSAGQTLMDSLGAGGAANTSCLPAANGLTKYYRVTVAAGDRLSVTASPTNFNLALRAFDSCGASSCTTSSDASAATTGVEQLTLQNDTAAPRDYFVSVSGGAAATASSAYTFSVQRAAYGVQTIMASCDDLSLAADVLGAGTTPAISDDAASIVLPLPPGFPFSFFRTPVTHYSVCVNGFAQLHSSAAGLSNNTFANAAMPSASQPNWVVAPFWDDLAVVPGQTRVRSGALGTAPNRSFTIEWFDVALNLGGVPGPERMAFQAKLFETTGVIEFHYCSTQTNGGSTNLVTGAGATVGLESGLGTEAIQWSFDRPGVVGFGRAMRFTPQ